MKQQVLYAYATLALATLCSLLGAFSPHKDAREAFSDYFFMIMLFLLLSIVLACTWLHLTNQS